MNTQTRSPEELRMDAQDMLQTMSEEKHRQLSPQKYRIVLIGKVDAFYLSRKNYIGQEGIVENVSPRKGTWCGCRFIFDNPEVGLTEGPNYGTLGFYKILLKKLGKRKILVE